VAYELVLCAILPYCLVMYRGSDKDRPMDC